LVEVLVNLPDHQLDFPTAKLHVHLLQHLLDVLHFEVLALVLRRQIFEHVQQVFLFSCVELELFQLLFDRLLLLYLLPFKGLGVELEAFLGPSVLHKQLTVLVLITKMGWKVL